jgi:hypothetical protein
MALAGFTGGPLSGQYREMDVYTRMIPIESYGLDPLGRPIAYYMNLLPTKIDSELHNLLRVHYVFFINGKQLMNVTKEGNYVP